MFILGLISAKHEISTTGYSQNLMVTFKYDHRQQLGLFKCCLSPLLENANFPALGASYPPVPWAGISRVFHEYFKYSRTVPA